MVQLVEKILLKDNQSIHRFSLEEYHKLGELGLLPRFTELIDGVILKKMTISPVHSNFVTQIRRYLDKNLPDQYIVREEKPITIHDSEPEPDISIITMDELKNLKESHPKTALFVLEVAVSSIEKDRAKSELYALVNIPEYWIINLNTKQIEIYRNLESKVYQETILINQDQSIPLPFYKDLKFSMNYFEI